MWFAAANSTFSYFWLFAALLRFGWGQDIVFPDEEYGYITSPTKGVHISANGSPMETSTSPMIPRHRVPEKVMKLHCSAPPQPVNGEWRLHPDLCEKDHVDCKVPEGTKLERSIELVYSCATGYRVNGDDIVVCRSNGVWSGIPSCIEITCGALNSVTRIANCFYHGKKVSCNLPVLPWTQADLSCRPGYTEVTLSTPQKNLLTCNEDGEWEPHPPRCIPGSLLQPGWSSNINNASQMNGVKISASRGSPQGSSSPFMGIQTSFVTPECPCLPQVSSKVMKSSCPAPPQPINGEWRIRKEYCDETHPDCKVPEGTELELSYELVYSCKPGFRANGDNIIYCRRNGKWSTMPSCIEIKCSPLNSVTRIAYCTHSRDRVSCDYPVLPTTQADLSCRPGYREDFTLLTLRSNTLICNGEGEWEPEPFRCIPECGKEASHHKPLLIEGSNATVSDFPWHVSLYKQKSLHNPKKDFKCGATLIHTSMLLTAAHCAYDETLGRPETPEKLFVMTGNFFREFDDSRHDLNIVRKSRVKYVHMYYTFLGLKGNYASDIALLELVQPFVFSEILLPACLDTSGSSAPFLEPGVFGKLAGFGKTVTGESSPILQTLTVPYIPHNKCKSSKHAARNQAFITKDKFCAGYTTGAAVCEGDSGGGLVFYRNDLWYVLGVVSVGLGVNVDNGERTCERYSYTLYTRVSEYMSWILKLIAGVKNHKPDDPQGSNLHPVLTPGTNITTSVRPTDTTPDKNTVFNNTSSTKAPATPEPTMPSMPEGIPTSSNIPALSACLVPPQPTNGQWKLDKSLCSSGDEDCDVSQGVALEPGSQLVYKCAPGYKVRGSTEVYCRRGGSWSTLPTCIEIKCSSLNSVSRIASCVNRSGDWISCDSEVPPGILAEMTCRPGYKIQDMKTQKAVVQCNKDGRWRPDPINCIPVCGMAMSRQTFQTDSTLANIGDFPWHASIHLQKNTSMGSEKEFMCGATLIQANLLLTAAHCIYDERTGTEMDPATLFVITGNIFRNYDSPLHDERIVKKRAVKNVYPHCLYYGLKGNFGSDIAVVELQEPFELSDTLLPACLDILDESAQILDAGAFGKLVGFGRAAVRSNSAILQTATVPYIPFNLCRNSDTIGENGVFFTNDKFCGSYTNDSTNCIGDSGGGLVFRKGGLWYVMGITSIGLSFNISSGEPTCDGSSYALYTKVSVFMGWIQRIISELAIYKSYPLCSASGSNRGGP